MSPRHPSWRTSVGPGFAVLIALTVAVGPAVPAAGQASAQGATSASAAMPTVESLSADGPWDVASYTSIPPADAFRDATVYHPEGASEPMGIVAVAPGYTYMQRHIAWLGPRLASHGFIVLTLDTNEPRDRMPARADALMEALEILVSEGERPDSPVFGLVDPNKRALMGHSMGGGGTLIAAERMGDDLDAAIPLNPYEPERSFSGITAPTMILTGEDDGIAANDVNSWTHFQSLPETTPRAYLEVEGGDHFISDPGRGGNRNLNAIGRFSIAWLKLHLDGDERYRDFVFGERASVDEGYFSRYEAHP